MKKYKKTYTIKKCLFCNLDIPKRYTESIATYYNRKFCKLSCQHQYNHKTNTSNIFCKNCNKPLVRKNSQLKYHNNLFCSKECFCKHRTKTSNKDVVCSWCGKIFKKSKSQILNMKKHFCSQKCMGKWQSKFVIGEFAYNYKDGSSAINLRIRSLVRYIKWRQKIYVRDNFTCQKCGDKKGGNLNAHHIKKLSKIIKDNNIKELIDAIRCKELWDINNGVTYCKLCHLKEHNS